MVAADVRSARPFHVEAYPRLDLRHAHKQVLGGRDLVLWYDQGGSLVGMARLVFDASTLHVDAMFRRLPYIPHGSFQVELPVVLASRGGTDDDTLTVCSYCRAQRRAIVFAAGNWLCMNCQRLVYRATIVSAHVRNTERLATLQRKLGDDRPHRMRRARFAALRAEEFVLRHELDDDLATPAPHQQWVLDPHWIGAPLAVPIEAPLSNSGSSRSEMNLPVRARSRTGARHRDVLELIGDPLFAGPSLVKRLERAIRGEIKAAFLRLKVPGRKVTGLQLRRQVSPDVIGDVPVLGPADAITIRADTSPDALVARLVVPIEGDAALLRAALPAPVPTWYATGAIARGKLVFEARFSPSNAPFVAALLHAELDSARASLLRQAEVACALRKAFAQLLKLVVAEELPKLGARRTRR